MYHSSSQDKKIGIICGSGPEAGICLWNLLVTKTRELLGDNFKGDVDMPHVHIISDPRLGASMNIENQEQKKILWGYLDEDISTIEENVDFFVIACYTLHVFQPEITAFSQRKRKFVSLIDCLNEQLQEIQEDSVALLHADVLPRAMCPLRRSIPSKLDVEYPKDSPRDLILEVKNIGPKAARIEEKFACLLNKCKAQSVILGCTELPLIKCNNSTKTIIDCLEIVAERLVNSNL